MNKLIIFALVIVGAGLIDGQVSDCREKLEKGISGLEVPAEIVEAGEEFKEKNPELVMPNLPSTFEHSPEIAEYLDQLPVDKRENLIKASGEYLKASTEMLRVIDCNKQELFKLIDVDTFLYRYKVNPSRIIDTFNGYYELSQRIFYRRLYAQKVRKY